MINFDQLLAALKRRPADVGDGKDPLALDTDWEVYGGIKSGKGRKIRSIICTAFLGRRVAWSPFRCLPRS